MKQAKLILIEGIAGSGKSTVGRNLAAIFHANNINAHFFHEFDREHPIRESNLNNSSKFIEKTITRWRRFVNDYESPDVTIFDGLLSQCFVAELIFMCADEEKIVDSVHRIADIVKVLGPQVIYLYQDNVRESVQKAYHNRNEAWQKKIDGFIASTGYGKEKKLAGLSGYVSFNQVYSKLLKRIMEDIGLACVSIETAQGEWPAYYKRISEFLAIPLPENSSIKVLEI